MPDDPTAPSLEMSQVATTRQRHEQRLTMRVVVQEIRSEIATLKADVEAVRALAIAQGERRTEDLRRMIHDEVATQLEPVLDGIKTLTDVIPLVPTLQQLAADYAHRANEQAARDERLTLLLTAVDNMAVGGWTTVKPLVYAVAGLVIASKAQTILALPSWTFWCATVLLVVSGLLWSRIHAFLSRRRGQP